MSKYEKIGKWEKTPVYTNGNSARIFQRNCYYVAIEKVYELTIANCNIITTLQTSRPNRALKVVPNEVPR